MKSTAPLAYAVAVSVSSRPNAVTKMIGVRPSSAPLPDQLGRLVAVQRRHPDVHQDHREAAGAGRRAARRGPSRPRRPRGPAARASPGSRGACRRCRRRRGRRRRARCRPALVSRHQSSVSAARPAGAVAGSHSPRMSSRSARLDRLGHVLGGARIDAALALSGADVRGQGDDREVRAPRQLAHGPHRRVAVHHRHHDVDEHDVDVRRALEDRDALLAALRRDHLELAALEQRGEGEDVAEVVVDHQRLHAGQAGADLPLARRRRLHGEPSCTGRVAGGAARRRRRRDGVEQRREVDGEGAALARACW